MSDGAATKSPLAKSSAVPADPDLSRDVEREIGREPLDRVKCVRVFGDFYRCNWWTPAPSKVSSDRPNDYGVLSTHYIRKSQFLNVKGSAGQLIIKEARP